MPFSFNRRLDEQLACASKAIAVLTVFLAGCVGSPITSPSAARASDDTKSPFVDQRNLDPAIPSPESVLGRPIGDGAIRYDAMVQYLKKLVNASSLITWTPYAVSHEGRELFFLTVTSKDNHERLDQIKDNNAKLADPRRLQGASEADALIDTAPAIAWMGYSIHGDELSSTDAAVQLAYQLVAGQDVATRQLRDDLVIHIDPLMNPDGRERYLSQLQQLVGQVPNHDYQSMQHSGLWSAGRGNHYLFDLNRDWVPQVHPETQGRAAKMLEWNPQLVVDSHEMGSLDTYLFDPPRDPINLYISKSSLDWRRRVSADQAKAFDKHGWSYYTGEWYEEWYPGYTNAWAGLQGAIGILYEQASVNGSAVKQAAGNTLTYQEAVHHQLVSSLANLTTLQSHRKAILRDYHLDRQWAVSAEKSGTETLVIPKSSDRARIQRFLDLMVRQGIEVSASPRPIKALDVVDTWGRQSPVQIIPADCIVIPAAQPRRRLLQALLDFDPHLTVESLQKEREDLENHRGTRMYDITAWNLCMAYGLQAYWAKSVSEIPHTPTPKRDEPAADISLPYGYLVDGASSDIHQVAIRLMNQSCKVRVAREPFTIDGYSYLPGTLLLRRHENPDDLGDIIRRATVDLVVDMRATPTALSQEGPDLGGQRFRLLESPRVAIASQWPLSSTSFGATWFLLDARTELRASPVNIQRLGRMDLRKYNVLVLPDAWGSGALSAILDKSVCKKLRSWVESGGTLVALGGSAAFLANKDRGLSAVRLRRDVLDQLPSYAYALEQETNAANVSIDAAQVWGSATTSTNAKPKRTAQRASKPTSESLKREDEWMRMFRPRGTIVAANLRADHWLTNGAWQIIETRIPVLLSTSFALMSKHPVQTPVRLVDADKLRLSGLLWPEARQRWQNSAYATVERAGYGQVILFASDPFFRGYFEGTGRLLLNAVVFGPGMGATQPVPW